MTDDAAASVPFDWDALARYLAGESPDAEAIVVRRWLDAHPGDAAMVRALDQALDRVAPVRAATVDVERALRDVVVRLDEPDVRPLRVASPAAASPATASPRAPSFWRRPVLRAAAVIAVASTGALAWWAARRAAPGDAAPARTYATAVGARDSVRLPDGSRVVLGPGSRLVVAEGFGGSAREVELVGEGWFDVVHDDARTFTVRAAGATIRDVGTAFTVRTGGSGADARVRVTVQHGAVLLDATPGDADGGVVLHQGDVGVVRADGHTVARPGTATDDDVAWTRGRLVFREAPLDEVRAELRRWYGVELRVDDATLAGRHVTASFDGEPADGVLRVLALALGARVERRGDTAVVRPGAR
jgi:transmembrane sensor